MSDEAVQHSSPATGAEAKDANGFHNGCQASASPAEGQKACAGSQVDRAEAMVERVAEKVSAVTATWGRRVWGLVSRVREEAEDLWGEAQSIRKGNQP